MIFNKLIVASLLFSLSIGIGAFEKMPHKKWTFMVFLNADNDLDKFGVEDMREMMQVGSNDWLNIIVLIDREKGPAALHYIGKDNSVVINDMGEIDMGDYNQLTTFALDSINLFPADHYALVVWNHGSGWKNVGSGLVKGISYDDSTGNHITTEQLGLTVSAIKKETGKNIDIFAMDACLMQMAEVAYVLKDHVDYVVASEETEPGEGYPYSKILGALNKDITPVEFAKNIAKEFVASYDGGIQGNEPSTQSVLNLARYNDFKDALDGLAKAMMTKNYTTEIKDVLSKVQKFAYRENIDLGHFLTLIKLNGTDDLADSIAKLELALNSLVVANYSSGMTMKNSHGLAIYFPRMIGAMSPQYKNLSFAVSSMWDDMIYDFYQKSTIAPILIDIEKGDLDLLRDYIDSTNRTPELDTMLKIKIRFLIHNESQFSASVKNEIETLLNTL